MRAQDEVNQDSERGQCHRVEVEGMSASVALSDFISQRKSHLMGMGSFMFRYLGQARL